MTGDDLEKNYYGFKLFFQYPFISYNNITYLPLPYLIINATTDSLYYRMTANNNELRTIVGKEILEGYLYKMFVDESLYDEVVQEVKYTKNRTEVRSPDIMIRHNECCVFVDSKSSVPSLKSREVDSTTVIKEIDISANNIAKLYKQIVAFYKGEYYPFSTKATFDRYNIFGIVVMLEDHYIRKNLIMERAREILALSHDDYLFLCSNVKIIGLYEIEKLIYRRGDVLSALIYIRDNPNKWYDIILNLPTENGSDMNGEDYEISTIGSFVDQMIQEFENDIEEMQALGIVYDE